jgi:hypothetical protein
LGADRAVAGGAAASFDGTLDDPVAGPDAGELEGDPGGGDDGDQPGSAALPVLAEPFGQVEGPADVVAGAGTGGSARVGHVRLVKVE